jgi:Ca-activated chloride channel family protein
MDRSRQTHFQPKVVSALHAPGALIQKAARGTGGNRRCGIWEAGFPRRRQKVIWIMDRWIKAGLFLTAAALISVQLFPQNRPSVKEKPPENRPFTISVKVGLVLLPVTVFDRSGEFVSGLQEKDFAVYEDGAPQPLELFDNKDKPVALGLLIDNSSSMASRRWEVIAASVALAESSNPEDEVFIAHFFNRVVFSLRLDQETLARDLDDLREAASKVPGSGKTALYDAVCAGLEHAALSKLQKKVLVVISDGGDNASSHTLSETLEMAKVSSTLIYTIGIFDERNRERSPEVLKQLAEISGGKAFNTKEPSELPEVCRHIAVDIRSQYTLGYMSHNQNKDGKFRKIRVEVRTPESAKWTVRTRSGYTVSR